MFQVNIIKSVVAQLCVSSGPALLAATATSTDHHQHHQHYQQPTDTEFLSNCNFPNSEECFQSGMTRLVPPSLLLTSVLGNLTTTASRS